MLNYKKNFYSLLIILLIIFSSTTNTMNNETKIIPQEICGFHLQPFTTDFNEIIPYFCRHCNDSTKAKKLLNKATINGHLINEKNQPDAQIMSILTWAPEVKKLFQKGHLEVFFDSVDLLQPTKIEGLLHFHHALLKNSSSSINNNEPCHRGFLL